MAPSVFVHDKKNKHTFCNAPQRNFSKSSASLKRRQGKAKLLRLRYAFQFSSLRGISLLLKGKKKKR
jgi:hypothetical protein